MPKTYFTQDHEWLTIEGHLATIGITDHAQAALGEVVFVELPSTGNPCTKGESIAVVESVKAASDIYAPLAGSVVEVNTDLEDSPEKLNEDPEASAWILKIDLGESTPDLSAFMDKNAYDTFISEE